VHYHGALFSQPRGTKSKPKSASAEAPAAAACGPAAAPAVLERAVVAVRLRALESPGASAADRLPPVLLPCTALVALRDCCCCVCCCCCCCSCCFGRSEMAARELGGVGKGKSRLWPQRLHCTLSEYRRDLGRRECFNFFTWELTPGTRGVKHDAQNRCVARVGSGVASRWAPSSRACSSTRDSAGASRKAC
jgi:hypothetical protein